jgi:BioD-like phosphotransacetylase family protein
VHVASQAFVSASQNTGLEEMRAMMLSMRTSFKGSNNTMADTIIKQSNSHVAMMEQQQKEMGLRMD